MRPDKRLGQHFLRDADVLQEIAAIADVGRSSGALEIGPGEGALTAFLVRSGRPVVALDKDPRAVAALTGRFGAAVETHLGDALEADLAGLLPPAGDGRRPIVVGNLPYNVGSAIYQRLLGLGDQIARMVLMLQREVAQRIVAEAGSKRYGVPSIATALAATAHLVLEVPPEAFVPRPKVHSALILVEPLATPLMTAEEQEPFLSFVKQLFQARRKTLANALGDTDALIAAEVDPRARVESLSLEALMTLYRVVSESPRSA